MQKFRKCPGTGKTRYPDPGKAKEALTRLRSTQRVYSYVTGKRQNRRMGKIAQTRYYHCTACNGYHLTSHEAPLYQKKREKLYKQRLKDTEQLIKNSEQAADWKKDSLPFPNQKNQQS